MADTLHTVPTKPLTREDRIELGRKAVEASQAGMSYSEFARSIGISDKTLGYYISVYKKSIGHKPKERASKEISYPQGIGPSKRTAVVSINPVIADQNEQIDRLKTENVHLKEKNAELQRSVKALQNVILILGHQHSEDD